MEHLQYSLVSLLDLDINLVQHCLRIYSPKYSRNTDCKSLSKPSRHLAKGINATRSIYSLVIQISMRQIDIIRSGNIICQRELILGLQIEWYDKVPSHMQGICMASTQISFISFRESISLTFVIQKRFKQIFSPKSSNLLN